MPRIHITVKHYLILVICFLLAEWIVNPIGEFPLADDWSYIRTTKLLYETGVFDLGYWGSMTLFSQLYWGLLFLKLFGFSYTVLRVSTLVLSLVGIFVFYSFLTKICKDPKQSLIGALLLLFNPLYFNLSNSYMTDVPYLTTLLIAVYSFYKYILHQKKREYILACLFFSVSILIRQVTVAFTVAIFLYGMLQTLQTKKIKTAYLLPLLLSVLTLVIYDLYLKHVLPETYAYKAITEYSFNNPSLWKEFIINTSKRFVHYFSHTGLFLMPFLVAVFPTFIVRVNKKQIPFLAIIAIPIIGVLCIAIKTFSIGPTIYNMGIGAETLYDTYLARINTEHGSSSLLYTFVLISSFVGSALLAIYFAYFLYQLKSKQITISKTTPLLWVISLFFAAYYLLFNFSNAFFDRYTLPIAVFVVMFSFFFIKYTSINKFIFYPLLCLLILYSVLGTKDYLEWNRQRWQAVNYLKTQQHVSDRDINAGFEHEAPLFYSEDWYSRWANKPALPFVITFGNVTGYKKMVDFTYQRYLPYKIDTVFVLQKYEN